LRISISFYGQGTMLILYPDAFGACFDVSQQSSQSQEIFTTHHSCLSQTKAAAKNTIEHPTWNFEGWPRRAFLQPTRISHSVAPL